MYGICGIESTFTENWSTRRTENATEAIFEDRMTKKMPQIEEAHIFKS